MEIAIDFDGTVCLHEYPVIGAPAPYALEVIRKLQLNGHNIILWTMRSGKQLDEAVEYLKSNGIKLYGVNENPTQKSWTDSNKCYCALYIDDAALGCPLIQVIGKRPYVDWKAVDVWLRERGVI